MILPKASSEPKTCYLTTFNTMMEALRDIKKKKKRNEKPHTTICIKMHDLKTSNAAKLLLRALIYTAHAMNIKQQSQFTQKPQLLLCRALN